MEIEPAQPRPQRGEALTALEREDLDLYAVEELDDRVERLQAEIGRATAAKAKKQAVRSSADALFSFRGG